MKKHTASRVAATALAITASVLLPGCGFSTTTSPDDRSSAIYELPELPAAMPVAKVGRTAHLSRFYDEETKVLCYMLSDSTSSPSCMLVSEPPKKKN